MCGDVTMNPASVMLGSVNTRSISNKGPLLTDTIASLTFDFLCLTETHIRTTYSDSFLCSLMPDGFSLIHRPHSSGIGGGVGFFIHDSYKYRNYSSFENMVISVSVSCRTDIHKLKALLESCNLRQSVNNATHLHGHILDLILPPSNQDMCVHVDICESINVLSTFLPLLLPVKQ